jgi:NADH dehydrogenase (ubiquinone) 1 alpha subcomplex subunit 10
MCMVPCVITRRYTNEKDDLMNFFLIPRFDVPELVLDAYDAYNFRKVWQNVSIMIRYLT